MEQLASTICGKCRTVYDFGIFSSVDEAMVALKEITHCPTCGTEWGERVYAGHFETEREAHIKLLDRALAEKAKRLN